MLERLRQAGMSLGLVTSGNRERVLHEIDRFGLHGIFSAVVCFEDTDEKALLELLRPSRSDLLIATPVSQRVNSVKNDDPECIAEVATLL